MYHSPSVNGTLIFKGIDWIVKCVGKLMFDNDTSIHCAINNKKFNNIKKTPCHHIDMIFSYVR